MCFCDRNIKLPRSATEIKSRFEDDEWQMSDAERSTLTAIPNYLKPGCAVKIVAYKAGSLDFMSGSYRHMHIGINFSSPRQIQLM